MGFPGSSAGKESACNAGHPSSIPGSGRSPGEGIGYTLQYSWVWWSGNNSKLYITLLSWIHLFQQLFLNVSLGQLLRVSKQTRHDPLPQRTCSEEI